MRGLKNALTILFTFCLGICAADAQLVRYWSFDETLDNAAKSAQSRGDGKIVGKEAYVAGRFGPCLDLDGASHVVINSTEDLDFTGNLSIALWCRVGVWDRPWQCLIAGGLGRRLHIHRAEDSEQDLAFGGGSDEISGGDVNDGKWHHVLAVSQVDWGTRLFIDGKQVAVGDKPQLAPPRVLMVGANPSKPGREWQGQLDDVGVFTRALNEYEAAAIVNLAERGYTLDQVDALFDAHLNKTQVALAGDLWTYVPRVELEDGLVIRLAHDRSGMRIDGGLHIDTFTVSKRFPGVGETVTLAWKVSGAESLTLRPGDWNLADSLEEGSITVVANGQMTYTLTASNAHGTASVDVSLHAGLETPVVELTEWMADSAGERPDSDGDKPDWIELHNPGKIAIPLENYFLTDDPEKPRKWALPAEDLKPEAYRVVYASGKDRVTESGEWHTNFKLDQGGEYLALNRIESDAVKTCAAIDFPTQRRGVSYGRVGGSASFGYLSHPTPGEINRGISAQELVGRVHVSHQRGFYEEPFQLELQSATDGAVIHYTLDGTLPTLESGSRYEGPIAIGKTATVRALAFRDDAVASQVATHTYIFTTDVIHQTELPPGLPSTWGEVAGDYGMDPDIVLDPRFRDRIQEDLRAVPSISIVLGSEDLFDEEQGIYANAGESGLEWERACSMEMVHPGGNSFQIDCGLRMQGGASRRSKILKHSMRLLFKREYGPSRLNKRVFPDTTATESFDTLILRAGFNKTWHCRSLEGEVRAQYLQDEFMRRTQRAMGHASAHGAFVHVYLNGQYWGVYNLVERPNAAFAAAYHGGKKEDWDALNSGKVIDGDGELWEKAHLLASQGTKTEETYQELRRLVDAINLTDYVILNSYGGNQDWDHHNWYAARKRESEGGFKFFSWDAEMSLGILTDQTGGAGGMNPTGFHSALLGDPDYRMAFADRMHLHCTQGGALTPERTVARYRQLGQEIERAIVCESARWGDVSRDHPYTVEDWQAERDRLLTDYLPRRTGFVLEQFRRDDLYPSVRAPSFQPHGGTTADVTLAAKHGEIWFCTDGSDPRLPGGERNPNAQLGTPQLGTQVRIGSDLTLKARTLYQNTWSALTQARYD